MKFNKMMTKVLSALIMVSMVGTSVQVPTLAEVTNAGRAIVAGTVEDKAKRCFRQHRVKGRWSCR